MNKRVWIAGGLGVATLVYLIIVGIFHPEIRNYLLPFAIPAGALFGIAAAEYK